MVYLILSRNFSCGNECTIFSYIDNTLILCYFIRQTTCWLFVSPCQGEKEIQPPTTALNLLMKTKINFVLRILQVNLIWIAPLLVFVFDRFILNGENEIRNGVSVFAGFMTFGFAMLAYGLSLNCLSNIKPQPAFHCADPTPQTILMPADHRLNVSVGFWVVVGFLTFLGVASLGAASITIKKELFIPEDRHQVLFFTITFGYATIISFVTLIARWFISEEGLERRLALEDH